MRRADASQLDARLAGVARAGAFATAAIGVLVMVGWVLGIDSLKRIHPALVAMKFNTAVGFVLAGAALWSRGRPASRLVLGALVTLLGSLTMGEHLSGRDFGIDQLLFREVPAAPAAAFPPGRMAPSTALSFLLYGVALLFLSGLAGRQSASTPSSRRSGLVAEALALAVATIGGFPLIGYLTGAAYLHHLPAFISMAMPTGAAFVLAAVGMLCAIPHGVLAQVLRARRSGHLLWLGFGVLIVLLATGGVVASARLQAIEGDVTALADRIRPRTRAARELEISVVDYGLVVREALAGDPKSRRRVAVDAASVERHLAEYQAVAETGQQQELASRFGAEWREFHALGQALLEAGGPPRSEELARLAAHRLRLERFLDDELLPDATAAQIAGDEATFARLRSTGALLLVLLVTGVLLALLTGAAVSRAVLAHEEALRESEERLKRAQAIAHLGSWELDLLSDKLTWSDEVYRIFGLPPQELAATYEGFLEAVHPDDRAAVDAAYSGSLREGKDRYEVEHRVVRRSGEVRVVQERCEHHRDGSGRVVRSVGMVHDVTERRQAELEREQLLGQVQRRAAELDATIESMADGLVASGADGRITRINANAERILGVTREFFEKSIVSMLEELQPRTASGAPPEEKQAGIPSALRGETMRGDVVQLRRRDGREVWVSSSAAPILIEGKVAGAVTTFVDITDRVQAEEDLKRSREGLSRLAEASLRVISETDLEAMLQAVSAAALELTGARVVVSGHGHVNGQIVIGGAARAPGMPDCPPGKVILVEKGGVYMELVEGGADTIRLTDEQMRAHPRWWGLPEGHVPMRGLLGVRLVDREGLANGMILVTDKEQGDFTAGDESLLRQLGTLASLASQHVAARIALEEADKSKNQFLAMLSHELRNPLAPIRNSLYVLERAAPGGEQAQRAQSVIDRQVTHLARLVDDLLDVTRISRGKIQLKEERIDFADVVRRAVDDHRSFFTKDRLELLVSIPDAPLWVHGDRTRLAQVIGNLLQNSAKFAEPGGKATVSVEGNPDLGQAIVRVRDTGAGIAPDMLPRIFEPFTQADTTLDRSKGGLGLGLALVKGLVELHGGTVSVESEGVGEGAEFTVRLPLESGVAPTAERPGGASQDGSARRVLVIEDNVDAANSLREVLELQGHTVEVAYSGADGIEAARAFRPEVVLCDIGLPGMDGYEVTRALRADEALRSTFLVALSGYALPEDLARAREAGFDRHLAKPPSIEKLTEILASAPSTGSAPSSVEEPDSSRGG